MNASAAHRPGLVQHPWLKAWSRLRFGRGTAGVPPRLASAVHGARVLVVGVYLGERPHLAASIARALGNATGLAVTQAWAAVGRASDDPLLRGMTRTTVATPTPKFTLINRLLAGFELADFDFVVVSDDDIALPPGFLLRYLALQQHCGFSLAQPARTPHSFHDHYLTLQRPWLLARRTRFVEIGPLFSVRADAYAALLPFDEASPMGWGYDYVWPVQMERAGLRMGIIDRTPVDHSLRPQSVSYSAPAQRHVMQDFLRQRAHLSRAETTAQVQSIWRLR
jgi:hypothetical protein